MELRLPELTAQTDGMAAMADIIHWFIYDDDAEAVQAAADDAEI